MGPVDKLSLRYQGNSLLEWSLSACLTARKIVMIAPPSGLQIPLPAHATRTSENPPFGGPVAGIAAGMAALSASESPWVLVLAGDLPEAPAAVAALQRAVGDEPGVDAYAALASDGWRQPLLAFYRRESLAAALAGLDNVRDVSVRRLVAGLRFCEVPLADRLVGDVDDPTTARSYGIEVPDAP